VGVHDHVPSPLPPPTAMKTAASSRGCELAVPQHLQLLLHVLSPLQKASPSLIWGPTRDSTNSSVPMGKSHTPVPAWHRPPRAPWNPSLPGPRRDSPRSLVVPRAIPGAVSIKASLGAVARLQTGTPRQAQRWWWW
jgi:hypothetical protein